MVNLHEITLDTDSGFAELEMRIGYGDAYKVLRMLESLEGVAEKAVKQVPVEDRFRRVICSILDGAVSQTIH